MESYLPLIEKLASSFSENINIDINTLPKNFTWADHNGQNYLT